MSKRDMSVGTDFDFDTSHFEESYTPPKKKKSEYPYVPKGAPLQLPPCRVCSGKASGIHYGVNSCEACKGFFRRYLLRKEPYKCNHGGNCEITDRHRGNCSACRMRKCLDLGMSKEGIRQGRYTLTERTKAIMEVKRLQNPELDFDQKAFDMVSAAVSQKNAERAQRLSVEDPLSCIQIPISPDCNRQQALSDISDDRTLADRLLDFSGFNSPNVSDELTDLLNPDYFFSEEMEIPSSVNMLSLDASPCSNVSSGVEVQLDLYDSVIDNLVGALNDMLPHSSQFTDDEIYAILKEGYDKYHLKARVFGPLNALSPAEYNAVYEKTKIDVDGRKQHLQFNKGTLEKMIKKYVDFSHTIPCFSDLPAQDQATLLKASRFEFFMLLEYRSLNPDLEMIQTYSGEVFHLNEACIYVPREMMKSWLEFTRTIRKLELTNKELAVTLAVALTFRDRCRLEQPSFLEQIQDNLVRMLCYLLEDHHGDEFMMTFSRIISMLTGLRGLAENYLLQFKTICSDKFIKQEMPELLDRSTLSRPDHVEEIQDRMITILFRLLEQRHRSDSKRRFCQIIDMFIKFRELSEGYMKCYQTMRSDKFLQDDVPETLKFLFDGW